MNRKLLNGMLLLAVAVGGVGTFTSCKDDGFANEVLTKENSLEAQIEALRGLSDTAFETELAKWLDDQTRNASAGMDAAFGNYKDMVVAAATMKDLYNQIMNGNIAPGSAAAIFADNLWNYLYNNKVKGLLDGLDSKIEANTRRIEVLEEALENQGVTLEDLVTRMQEAEDNIEGLQTAVEQLGLDLEQLRADYVEGLGNLKTEMENKFTEVEGQISGLEGQISGLESQISVIESEISDLETEISELDSAISGVADNLATLTKDFDDFLESFSEYEGIVAEMFENLNKRATAIAINQVVNPIFGTINLPLGINSTVLATYVYGGSDVNYSFPAQAPYHITPASPFDIDTDADLQRALKTLAAASEDSHFELVNNSFTDPQVVSETLYGNMGGAVVGINPLSTDITSEDYTVEIVNAKGEVAFSTEDKTLEVAKFNDDLYFGMSRADVNNGLYTLRVNASSKNSSNLRFDLDKSNLKDAIKQLVDNKTISNVAHLAETVFKSVNNQLPAYAVKVSWNEAVENESSDNAAYSDYALAATILHPLSYNTEISQFIPADKKLPVVHNKLVDIIQSVQNRLYFGELEGIEPFELEITFSGNGKIIAAVLDQNGNPTGDYIELEYTEEGIKNPTPDTLDQFINDLLTSIQDDVDQQLNQEVVKAFNRKISQINTQIQGKLNGANNYLENLKSDNKVRYAQKLVDIYNELAGKVNDFLADPNHYLQVMVAYSLGDGAHHLSNDIYMPDTFYLSDGNKLSLVTTSYNADLVVPSYKKYIAITGVVNSDKTISTDNIVSLNQQAGLNKVYSGHQERVEMNLSALQGKTVRVSYISVDYRGMCSMENYYLTVK